MTLVTESLNDLIFYRSLQGNSPSALAPRRKVRAQRPHAEQKAWSMDGLQSTCSEALQQGRCTTAQRNPSQDLRLKKSHPDISNQNKPKTETCVLYTKYEKCDEMMLLHRERQQIQARLKSTVTLNQQHNATGGTSEQQRNPFERATKKQKTFSCCRNVTTSDGSLILSCQNSLTYHTSNLAIKWAAWRAACY